MGMKYRGLYAKDNAQKGEMKLSLDFSKLTEDRSNAPDEVEQKIIDLMPFPTSPTIDDSPAPTGMKYGLKELLDAPEED
jgi:hypothetical protein